MNTKSATLLAIVLMAAAAPVLAQDDSPAPPRGRPPAIGPIPGDKFKTQFIRLGQQGEGMLYEPATLGPKSRIAVIYSHPGGNNFNAPIARELANRGYRVMNVNFRGDAELGMEMQLPTISLAIGYIRSQPGVQKVVIAGHSGGGHQMALYDNVAEHGPSACSGPEKIYPCKAAGLERLNKPDGIMLIDPPLGAFHEMSSIDPAVDKDVNVRNPALDMYAAANDILGIGGRAGPLPGAEEQPRAVELKPMVPVVIVGCVLHAGVCGVMPKKRHGRPSLSKTPAKSFPGDPIIAGAACPPPGA